MAKIVLQDARSLGGLTLREAWTQHKSFDDYISALQEVIHTEVLDIRFHLPAEFSYVFYKTTP